MSEKKPPTVAVRPPPIKSIESLVEEVDLPPGMGEICMALQTGRPELIKMYKPKEPLSVEQGLALANLVRVLLKTNQAIQEHYMSLSVFVDQLADNVKGLGSKIHGLMEMVNFTPVSEDGG